MGNYGPGVAVAMVPVLYVLAAVLFGLWPIRGGIVKSMFFPDSDDQGPDVL